MNWNKTEIESLVRRIVTQALDRGALSSPNESSQPKSIESGSVIGDRVISLESLRKLPLDCKAIEVSAKAVITPAVKDWLREKGIAIVREERRTVKPVSEAPIAVLGTAPYLSVLKQALCPKQCHVEDTSRDATQCLRDVRASLRQQRRLAWLLVDNPYAEMWQASRDDTLRSVVVRDHSELVEALQQVPANLIIASWKAWQPYPLIHAIKKSYRWISQSHSTSYQG